jgi:RNA recognition motif-containing protein
MGGNAHMQQGFSLFVYNLPPDTDDSLLPRIFSQYGMVLNTRVIRDPAHGRCKGYGFVTMKYYQEAVAAIQGVHGQRIGPRTLEVSFKTDNKKKRAPGVLGDGPLSAMHFGIQGGPQGMMGDDPSIAGMHQDPHHPM